MRERILRQPGGMGLSLRSKSRRQIFHPSFVPEIARGYFWEVASAVGIGTAGFLVPEGNGHTTFNLVAPTIASHPTQLAENGGQQFRMRKTVDAAPSILATAGNVTAGWTGATYAGIWVRIPDAAGDATNTNSLFAHHVSPTTRRFRLILNAGATDELSGNVSNDGANSATSRFNDTLLGSAWHWLELIFDPLLLLGGTLAKDRLKLFSDFVQQPLGSVQDAQPTSVNNSTCNLCIGCNSSVLGNFDTTDWAAAYYADGIPSLSNRVKTSNRKNPTGILLAA